MAVKEGAVVVDSASEEMVDIDSITSVINSFVTVDSSGSSASFDAVFSPVGVENCADLVVIISIDVVDGVSVRGVESASVKTDDKSSIMAVVVVVVKGTVVMEVSPRWDKRECGCTLMIDQI